MKNLRPTYDQNGQKQGKTGNFCKKWHFGASFTQPRLEHARIFSVFLPYSAQKFPTKITGNFLDHIRDFSANNREFDKITAKSLFRVYIIFFEKKESKTAQQTSILKKLSVVMHIIQLHKI